jgi:hypothetical protein
MATPDASPSLTVGKGALICIRVFDFGDEFRLSEAEQLLKAAGKPSTRRTTTGLDLMAQPLTVPLGTRQVPLGTLGTLTLSVGIDLYAFGNASVVMEWALPAGTSLAGLIPVTTELMESELLHAFSRKEVELLLPVIRAATVNPHSWDQLESYTVVYVERLGEGQTAEEIREWPDLSKLLIGEQQAAGISRRYAEETRECAFSLFADELTVVDWNCALVLEPSGARDMVHLLEYANVQLATLRYYDELIDRELDSIYDDFAKAEKHALPVLAGPYGQLAHKVFRRLVEVAEVTERVDNSIKVVGDFYLARVYHAAVRRMRIDIWAQGVDRKLELIRDVYDMLKSEVEIRRGLMLELTVILLIVFEVLLALRGVQ